MQLAIFDLDNTLIGGDSDYLWGEYLYERGLVDRDGYREQHQRYYDDYRAGILDIDDFLRFQLQPLADNELPDLLAWRRDYMQQKILPIMLDKAMDLINSHRQCDHELLIITATNRFITEPIAEAFGVQNLIATDPEFIDGRYTGAVVGIPAYRDGKIRRLGDWLANHNLVACEKWFYSDSHNDIPLLEQVDHAIAVDPDEELHATAQQRGWLVISLR